LNQIAYESCHARAARDPYSLAIGVPCVKGHPLWYFHTLIAIVLVSIVYGVIAVYILPIGITLAER
jgi:hypothetical protein